MAVGLLAALFENIAFLVRFYSCAFVFGSIPYLLLVHMSSFAFNFFDNNDSQQAIHDSNEFSAGDKTHPLEFLPCSDDIPSGTTFEPTTIGPATIYHVRPSGELVDGTVTDLIPGVYGGGKVVWECSIDLANYVFSKPDTLPTGK